MDIERRTELVRAARALFRGKRAEAGTTREIGKLLGARERELPELQEILGELEEAGLAVHVQGRGWLSPRAQGWIVGTLTVNRRGFGFVRPANEDEQEGGDLFVPERKIKDAHHGDLVLVKVRSKGRDAARGRGKPRVADAEAREGRVLTVLRRSPRIILGRFWEEPAGGGVVEPLRHESVREIFVPPERIGGADDGDRVLARLLDAPTWGGLPQGEVVEVALPEGSWEADLQLICAEHGIRREFPEEALEAAAALPGEIPQEELARRTDLRDVDFFTIDPSDAKDHDDAIALQDEGPEGFLLGVAIADVSHFVPPNGPVDREAYERATSVYLPGLTVPMLPERLSTDLCSLRPAVDRLAKVVWIDLDPEGRVRSGRVEKAVIRSRRRFSYSEVQELLDGAPPSEDEAPWLPALEGLDRLRAALHARRMERGSLDLDLAEMRLRLDESGEVVSIEPKRRDRSHHIVEECMLAANEAVARVATERSIAILRRAHEEPPEEDVVRFLKICRVLAPGLRMRGTGDFPSLVEQLGEDPASPIIQLAMLRTLTRAAYAPAKALHFALATDEYCHFTSPIRRYPDLQVHRALDDALFGGRRTAEAEAEARIAALGVQADHSSERERAAEDAERDMQKLRAISFIRHRVGDRLPGVVAAVRDHGFFVSLDEFLIEGMVHISTLRDDYYVHDESRFALRGRNTGRQFQLGDAVEVELTGADPLHRTIDLRYLQHLGSRPVPGEGERPPRKAAPGRAAGRKSGRRRR
ncbi:MAG: ribonuclease R [Planctomycetota bacterium]|jgi:ribonuclease R